MMTVPSQLEAVQLGTNVSLRCKSEAFPASINYWVRGAGETVSSGPRLRTSSVVQDHVTHMRLDITAATAASMPPTYSPIFPLFSPALQQRPAPQLLTK